MRFRISGTGCALMDYIYTNIQFSSDRVQRYLSRKPGDGGLSPGRLTMAKDFERFAEKPYQEALLDIVGTATPDVENLGGPAIVALITASQLFEAAEAHAVFHGIGGHDHTASEIRKRAEATPLDMTGYKTIEGESPFTVVLSDPTYNDGQGERIFVNSVGAAARYDPGELPAPFFEGDIVFFGGTALVPPLHRSLTELVKEARQRRGLSVVATVYDFISERDNPGGRWPLGESDETYAHIGLLITDAEEARRLSGRENLEEALSFFRQNGVEATIITHGAEELHLYAAGPSFQAVSFARLPVSERVSRELSGGAGRSGDTTGCGDNFVGGVLAGIAFQRLARGPEQIDIRAAVAWGVAAGGLACYYAGGTKLENRPRERYEQVREYAHAYAAQIGLESIV